LEREFLSSQVEQISESNLSATSWFFTHLPRTEQMKRQCHITVGSTKYKYKHKTSSTGALLNNTILAIQPKEGKKKEKKSPYALGKQARSSHEPS